MPCECFDEVDLGLLVLVSVLRWESMFLCWRCFIFSGPRLDSDFFSSLILDNGLDCNFQLAYFLCFDYLT
jgi:hypothetical protein